MESVDLFCFMSRVLGMGWMIANSLDDMQATTFFWSGVIMAVAVVGFVAIMIFKRLWRHGDAPAAQEAGFSLADLRAMRDRGEITPEEYEQTRAKVIAQVKKLATEPPKPKPGPRGETPTDAES
jgi:uncharacterized membrane protein